MVDDKQELRFLFSNSTQATPLKLTFPKISTIEQIKYKIVHSHWPQNFYSLTEVAKIKLFHHGKELEDLNNLKNTSPLIHVHTVRIAHNSKLKPIVIDDIVRAPRIRNKDPMKSSIYLIFLVPLFTLSDVSFYLESESESIHKVQESNDQASLPEQDINQTGLVKANISMNVSTNESNGISSEGQFCEEGKVLFVLDSSLVSTFEELKISTIRDLDLGCISLLACFTYYKGVFFQLENHRKQNICITQGCPKGYQVIKHHCIKKKTKEFETMKAKNQYLINQIKSKPEVPLTLESYINKAENETAKGIHLEMDFYNYLDNINKYPFGVKSNESYDLQQILSTLNTAIFGQDQAKKEILDHIAQKNITGEFPDTLLLLSGIYGSGKEELIEALAKATKREFVQIIIRTENDLLGANGYPSKIGEGISKSGVTNPVILADITQYISPLINNNGTAANRIFLKNLHQQLKIGFNDNYYKFKHNLTVPWIILEINSENPENGNDLQDFGYELINFHFYSLNEKNTIFNEIVIPKAIKKYGINGRESEYKFNEAVLHSYRQAMLFEPGISITKIIAEKLVKRMTQKLLLGQPAYLENDEYKNIFNKWNEIGPFLFNETMIGTANGLGVTININGGWSYGTVFFFEAAWISQADPKNQNVTMKVTRRTAEKMVYHEGKETKVTIDASLLIAQTFARRFVRDVLKANTLLDERHIHFNFPSVDQLYDGGSAGIMITTCFVSLALNQTVRPNIAMTGEITLSGNILKIGGLFQKLMGGYLAGIREFIVPLGSKYLLSKDLHELPGDVIIYFVKTYDEAFPILFPNYFQ